MGGLPLRMRHAAVASYRFDGNITLRHRPIDPGAGIQLGLPRLPLPLIRRIEWLNLTRCLDLLGSV